MSRQQNRIAANPIPYWLKGGKTREVFEEAFRDFREIGFTAVKADVPEGMTPEAYAVWIVGYGLAPSLSLFSSPFDETVDMAAEVERAKRFAAEQVALGLDRTMISSMEVPARRAHPAVGADYDEGRLTRAVDNCGRRSA
jgi:inosose dehydratase